MSGVGQGGDGGVGWVMRAAAACRMGDAWVLGVGTQRCGPFRGGGRGSTSGWVLALCGSGTRRSRQCLRLRLS